MIPLKRAEYCIKAKIYIYIYIEVYKLNYTTVLKLVVYALIEKM